ncbi:TonB-dependent receptor [Fretibacter rubidus]|uniref:TonB-dependent receptor n=1 Tax=Fretibacter rubidus TaxID=570162 RepID=UPI00352A1C94
MRRTNFKSSHMALSASIMALSLAVATPASAQFLTGKVTDSTGQTGFQGAVVTIDGTNRSTTTDRFGNYRINNLLPGTYDVTVSYIGASNVNETVTVPAQGADLNIVLGNQVDFIDNVIVVGTRAAQASAINQQRAADSIKTIIDSDGLGNFPDTTVADSLQRAVGLSVETDQGEGRYVSIRGINTDLISSSINGVRTPSPEDRRGVLLDGVPSDLLDGIEIQKSLTPDVDADSLGGVINLKTISAFDRKGQFVRGKIEGQYNEITDKISPKATLTYSNTFNDIFGMALSVNYQNLNIESHNNETGEWALDDDSGLFFVADDYEQRWYDLTRERLGLVANFDFRISDNTDLYVRTLFNQYTDDEVRNKFEFREFDEEIIAISPTSVSIRRGEVDAEARKREEVRNIETYSIGGKTELDKWNFDYQAAYAYAQEDDSNNHDVAFRSTPEQRDSDIGSITLDYSDPQQPVISGPALDFLLDPSNYELDAFEQEFTTNEDTELSAQFNVSRDSLLGDTQVVWKAGMKYRDREKVRDQNLVFYERDDVNMADFIRSDSEITNWRLVNRMFEWPDANLTEALRGTFTTDELQEDDSFLESTLGDFEINEKIFAAYGMGTFNVGDATIVAGVRLEQTNVDLMGNFVEEGSTDVTLRNVSDDYTDILPSLNVKYDFTDKVIGRAAYYAAVVRPSFGDMAPNAFLNEDRDEIELGNPNLEAYGADNFDLGLEFYPTSLSVISVGLFYKDIANAIFPARFDVADVPDTVDLSFLPAATLAGLDEITTSINVGKSELYGVEFNYVQNLGDLSEALDGFLFSGNLTLTDSESTLPDGRVVPFLKQSNAVGNIAIGYDKGPWDLRVSANFRGDYLDGLEDEDLDRITDDRLLIEASAKYKFNDNIQVYVEGKNLTDAPEYYYFGDTSRLSQYDEFGRSVVIGARLTY